MGSENRGLVDCSAELNIMVQMFYTSHETLTPGVDFCPERKELGPKANVKFSYAPCFNAGNVDYLNVSG
jgi:hypothetical protein